MIPPHSGRGWGPSNGTARARSMLGCDADERWKLWAHVTREQNMVRQQVAKGAAALDITLAVDRNDSDANPDV